MHPIYSMRLVPRGGRQSRLAEALALSVGPPAPPLTRPVHSCQGRTAAALHVLVGDVSCIPAGRSATDAQEGWLGRRDEHEGEAN